MKRTLVISAMAATTMMGLSMQNANASKKDPVNPKTAKAIIRQDFPQAEHLTWRKQGKNLIATFTEYGNRVTATYSANRKLASTLVWSSDGDMPFEIRTDIAKKYTGYAVQCVKEYISKKRRYYYIILNKRNKNQLDWVSLQSDSRGELVVIQKLHQTI